MRIEPIGIGGCYLVLAMVLRDLRGSFTKSFHQPNFEKLGLRTDWREEYFTSSYKDVIRGMHFQLPPQEHAKLVFCVSGRVLDVVLDLRRGSPTFGEVRSAKLSSENGVGLYIPAGCAHGFLSLVDESVMQYKVTSVYSPEQDAGIAYDSFGFDWMIRAPILSDRDRAHPPLAAFDTPF